MEKHPFNPKLIANTNSNKHINNLKNLGEEMNNTRIPIYEKLYR